jgi:hypothetical protein
LQSQKPLESRSVIAAISKTPVEKKSVANQVALDNLIKFESMQGAVDTRFLGCPERCYPSKPGEVNGMTTTGYFSRVPKTAATNERN